jgi:hypothetical protein
MFANASEMDNHGWTIETLKEHIEKILAEKDKAINIALAAAKEAVGVAEKNAEKWRDNANEWRAAMNDKDKTLMQKAEFVTYKEGVEKALATAKEKDDRGEGKNAGFQQFIGWIVAAAAILGFIVTNFVFKK